jgi:hypothetical protein
VIPPPQTVTVPAAGSVAVPPNEPAPPPS